MKNDDFSALSPEQQIEVLQEVLSPWRFGERYLVNRDGTPRRYWDHQKAELDDPWPKKIHRDATGTGKTIAISTSILHWGATTQDQEAFCAAPLSGFLNIIIEEIEFQISKNPDVRAMFAPGDEYRKKQPYFMFRFAGGSTVKFFPAGIDGAAYDGQHVSRIWVDQACTIPQKAWPNLFQRLNPGGILSIYSYHDGRRNTTYHKLQVEATETPTKNGDWKLYHWPATILPAPFWSETVRQEKIREHGGESSPEYQRLVLGLVGTATTTAFDLNAYAACQKALPTYRIINVDPDVFAGSLGEDEIDHIVSLLFGDVGYPGEPGETTWGGTDLGYTSDPAEIVVARERVEKATGRTKMTALLRVHMERVPYTAQTKIVAQLDRNFHFSAFGIDRGGVGVSFEHMLHGNKSFDDLPHRRDRFLPFVFGGSIVVDKDDDGVEKKDETKRFSTSLLNRLFQRRVIALPKMDQAKNCEGDDEADEQFWGHTYGLTDRHVKYYGVDHIIDAWRVLVLARETVTVLHKFQGGVEEVGCVSATVSAPVF